MKQFHRADLVFIIIVIAFFAASFFPELRLWGLNGWAYFPVWARTFIVVIGLAGLFLSRKLLSYLEREASDNDRRTYIYFTVTVSCLMIALFYIFRAQTYFLGDGYEAIKLLNEPTGVLKKTNYGEVMMHIWVAKLLPESIAIRGLVSYQILSIGAGMDFLTIAAFFSWKLTRNLQKSILWFCGIVSSGYMLLYFGYVENYSIFVLSVMIFAMVGILVVSERISKLWILPAFAFSLFLHVFGTALVLPTIYVLVRGSSIGEKIKNLRTATKAILALLIAAGGLVLFGYFYNSYMFLRFAIVPVLNNQFTIDGYTLFSVTHLLDFLNLTILLVPGLPLLLLLKRRQCTSWVQTSSGLFLILLATCCFAIAFIFDPKLGMPRDWDLFSFVGIPLCLSVFSLFLSDKKATSYGTKLAMYAIVIGLISLTGRVGTGVVPASGLQQFRDYLKLDHARGRNASLLLVNYFEDQSNFVQSKREIELWSQNFPERTEFFKARKYADEGQLVEAIRWYESIVQRHPDYFDAWSNLGTCYLNIKRYDGAIECLKIAIGLNPYNGEVRANLGLCYVYLGQFDLAEENLLEAEEALPDSWAVVYNLSTVYKSMHNKAKYVEYLEKTIRCTDGPVAAYLKLVKYYSESGRTDEAKATFSTAINKGADTLAVIRLVKKYPYLSDVIGSKN